MVLRLLYPRHQTGQRWRNRKWISRGVAAAAAWGAGNASVVVVVRFLLLGLHVLLETDAETQ